MPRFNIVCTIGSIALAVFSLQSCTRSTNADNINVITKPYSLHFADSMGTVYSTYDGERFDVLTATQGVPVEGLATTDKYILMKMMNGTIMFKDDGGQGSFNNFNPSYSFINPAAFGSTYVINLPNYNDSGAVKRDRIYIASNAPGSKGIAYNDSNGTASEWFLVNEPGLGTSVTSFAALENKAVVAFDDVSRAIWVKPDLATAWTSKTAAGLPGAGTGRMYIISQKNDIHAVMVDGDASNNGIYRSTDQGNSFAKLPDNPITPDITCAAAPFGKVLIACTRDNGVWRLSGQGAWERASIGLKNDIHVFGITFKSNKFKGGQQGEYVFIATSDGIYRSDDLGQTWIRLNAPGGNVQWFTAIY